MRDIRTKQLTDHVRFCFAVQATIDGEWPTPWAYLERVEKRISNGNKAGPRQSGDRWWFARCNDPSCGASIVINEDDLLAVVEGSGE